jgi:tetratricopeptide (TPR) repeat protein
MVKRAHSVISNRDNRQQSKTHQLIHKAQAASEVGDLEGAEKYCGQALDLGHDKTSAYYALGVIYRKAGHQGLALNAFLDSINEKKDNVYALVGAAAIFVEQGDYPRARKLLDQCLEYTETFADAYQVLGECLIREHKFEEGIAAGERARSLAPSNSGVLTSLANAYAAAGDLEKSLGYREKALRASPKDPVAINNLASGYIDAGRTEEAGKLIRKAIRLAADDPKASAAYINFGRFKKWSREDEADIRLLEEKLEGSLPLESRVKIHFALAKIYDDCKDFGKAFHHAQLANRLSNVDYPIEEAKSLHKSIRKTGDPGFCGGGEDCQDTRTRAPIFVIGFPRSGSTLLEQILDTSEAVVSVGETGALTDVIGSLDLPWDKKRYGTNLVERVSARDPSELRDGYFERVARYAPGVEITENSRYLDKTLGDYMYLGLIARIFPDAKIIHTLRNPLDTCLSCYLHDFMRGIRWSYDLRNLGRYYAYYRELMDYWGETLPDNFLTLRYEEMVADPEGQSRRIFEYSDLEWSPKSLEFYKLSKSVNTASSVQVREPVYKRAVHRWHNYASHLQPLAKELRGYLSDEDFAYLAEQGIKLKRRGFFPF